MSDLVFFSTFLNENLKAINWLKNINNIKGWLDLNSAFISASLIEFQNVNRLNGNICEIGVYHGKYLVGLASCLRAEIGEGAIAVDIFEHQDLNDDLSGYDAVGELDIHHLKKQFFLNNFVDFCDGINLTVIQKSSLEILPRDLIIDGNYIRFFSIDGGHTMDVFMNDLRLAESVLSPHGIVSIDDIMNPEWGGIPTSMIRYLDNNPKLIPIAIIPNKLLCCFPEYVDIYREAIIKIAPKSLIKKNVEFSNYSYDLYGSKLDIDIHNENSSIY